MSETLQAALEEEGCHQLFCRVDQWLVRDARPTYPWEPASGPDGASR